MSIFIERCLSEFCHYVWRLGQQSGDTLEVINQITRSMENRISQRCTAVPLQLLRYAVASLGKNTLDLTDRSSRSSSGATAVSYSM